MAKRKLSLEEMFDIYYRFVELKQPLIEIAKAYNVSHTTIYRENPKNMGYVQKVREMLADPEIRRRYDDWIEQKRLPTHLWKLDDKGVPTSPYPTVRNYINNARYMGTDWSKVLYFGMFVWAALDRKDPAKWTPEEVKPLLVIGNQITYRDEKGRIHKLRVTKATKYALSVAIRNLAPHLQPHLPTDKPKDKIEIRLFKDTYMQLLNLPESDDIQATEQKLHWFEKLIFKTHVTLGCREGSRKKEMGLLSLKWRQKDPNDSWLDLERKIAYVYETKVRKGILWRDCPLDLFHSTLPEELKQYRNASPFNFTIPVRRAGKIRQVKIDVPVDPNGRVFPISYHQLTFIYDHIEQILEIIKPDFGTKLTPHMARHIHVNLLWERGIPLEVVAGDAKAGLGYLGVGWTDLSTLKDFYLTMAEARIRQYRERARLE